jgi:hypothetical protein
MENNPFYQDQLSPKFNPRIPLGHTSQLWTPDPVSTLPISQIFVGPLRIQSY